ncbi:MAG: GNAT family N-acetyltransferase [Azospirillaceae bacterium]
MAAALAVTTMTRADLDIAVEWAAAEGWNPGLDDADAFLAADAGGFLIGRLGAEPVAVISAVRYGREAGFLGFYIVAPARRGQGHGWAIWQAAMARFGERPAGLDGVVAQQANYARSGFVLAHKNIRYGGRPGDLPEPADVAIVEASAVPIADLLDFDRRHFQADRAAFARAWYLAGGRQSRVALADGRIVGLATVRPCREGHKIGPLFAEDAAVAEALFADAVRAAAPGPVFLDVPEPNAAARALAERHGLEPVFETARMYRGAAPDLPLGRIFGITSFELG